MNKYQQMRESGITDLEITAQMKADGLTLPWQRADAWGTKTTPAEVKTVAKKAVKKATTHDLSGVQRILSADKTAKGTTGSMAAKLSTKEVQFLNDIADKSKLTEKQAFYLKSIGNRFSETFNEINVSKQKVKKGAVSKISFEEYVSEFLDQHLSLMGEKERAEAYRGYMSL